MDRGVPWPKPIVKDTTGSTNSDVAALALDRAPEGTIVVADEQTAGRGRLGRTWASAHGAGLWFSVLVRVDRGDHDTLGLLPLAAGVSVADAIRRRGLEAVLKWPNDVVVVSDASAEGVRKLAGILCESDGAGAAVIGIGINVSQSADELPVASATSLALEGVHADRAELLVDVLTALYAAIEDLRGGGARTTVEHYRQLCATLGRDVVVALPTGDRLVGRATELADDGRLGVEADGNVTYVAAGDVTHATI